jgi:hypothetical protein
MSRKSLRNRPPVIEPPSIRQMDVLFNWLRSADKFHISGRGDVYAGPSPFSADKAQPGWQDRFCKVPWVISHRDARDKVFQCIGIESYCIQWIRDGMGVGLLVREIKGKELDEWWPIEPDSQVVGTPV